MSAQGTRSRLLLIEDKSSLRKMLTLALEKKGHEVVSVATAEDGRTAATDGSSFDLVLSDLQLPDGTGIDVLETFRRAQPGTPFVVMTAFGSVDTAVQAMKLGAVDFLEKPVELPDLFALVARWIDPHRLPSGFQPPGNAPMIVGSHPKIRAALRLLRKVAPLDSTVLLCGESGTGKELFARAAHALSERRNGPFVAVNCAAIPESLMENELFGHEKGAFTGASERRSGRFEQAKGGTIFLDEIGELKPEVQGKVLRVLEEKVFERVGGGRSIHADARVVTATNRDLKSMVAAGTFRQDLFYRLEVFPIELPPLRERDSDIPDLVHHLAARIGNRLGIEPGPLPSPVLDAIHAAPWPGNIRQLANFVERALILTDGRWTRDDVLFMLEPEAPSLEERVRDALLESNGDKTQAASLLDMSYRTLQRHIKELDLEGFPRYRR